MRPRAPIRNPWRQRPASRRGISLIEVVAAATLGSLIIGLAVTSLLLAIRNSDAAHYDLAARNEQNRLARQFRCDVHAARQAMFDPGPDLVTLSDGTRQIRYRRDGNSIERSETSIIDSAPANRRPATRETFRIPPDDLLAIEVIPAGTTSILRLKITRATDLDSSAADARAAQAADTLQNHAIDAWLGRDHRGAGVTVTGTPSTDNPSTAAADSTTKASTIAHAPPAEVAP